ncbi:hypothetical protein [Paractinoplanes brasiliensis]|nr:hypothetical protein [Actinoplanes brasiliensis]
MRKTIKGAGHPAAAFNVAFKRETTTVKHRPIGYLAKGGGYDGEQVYPAEKGRRR